MDNSSKVVIITLNFNQNDYTIACVNSLLKSNYTNFEILLIDNGSSSSSFSSLLDVNFNDDRLIIERIEKNIGYVGGINCGLKMAKDLFADYFIIMNNDTIICENAITEFVNSSKRNNDNAIITGKVYHYDEPNILQDIGQYCRDSKKLDYPPIIPSYFEEDIGQYNSEEERGMIDDIFWILPKKIFEQIGYYSDFFYLYGEQNDYALRAVKNGYKLIYTPKPKLWHKGGVTTSDSNKNSARINYWTTFGTLKLSILHLSTSDGVKFRVEWIMKNFFKKVILLIKGKISFSIIMAFMNAIYNFYVWKKNKYIDNGYNPY